MKLISILLLTTALLSLSLASFSRNRIWLTELSLWTDASNKNRPRPSVLTNLAHALDTSGYISQAIKHYQMALSLGNYPRAHNNLGVIYFENSNKDLGFKHLNAAIRANPVYIEARYNLATAYQELEDHSNAIVEYNKLLKINPKHFKALNNLGLSYHKIGKHDLAISSFKKALKVNKGHLKVIINLASSYISNKENAKAESLLQRVINSEPLNREAHKLLNKVTNAPTFYQQ